jgi:hypothetical protein
MKNILMITGILICSIALKGQTEGEGTLNFNAYGGYSLPAKVRTTGAYIRIRDGFQYGGGFEYFVADNKSFELKYLRLGTQFPLYNTSGIKLNSSNDKGSLNYILFGGNNYFGKKPDTKIRPFAGMSAGISILSALKTRIRFAWDAKVGIRIIAAPKVSVKCQAFAQSIISTFGSDYWTYPGGTFLTPKLTASFQVGLGAIICFDISDL